MIGKKLKLLRQFHGLTETQIAGKLFVSQKSYSRLELDNSRLKAEQALKLCDLYNITLEELFSAELPKLVFNNCSTDNQHDAYKQLADERKIQNEMLVEKIKHLTDENSKLRGRP